METAGITLRRPPNLYYAVRPDGGRGRLRRGKGTV